MIKKTRHISFFSQILWKKVSYLSYFSISLIWKNYILNWDFEEKSWIVDYFPHEKTPQNNFLKKKKTWDFFFSALRVEIF